MPIEITKMYGLLIGYDKTTHQFTVEDKDGTRIAVAETQNEAERKAKAYSKQDFQRIPIFRLHDNGRVILGQLTSVDREDQSAWVNMEASQSRWGREGGRQKVNLTFGQGYYELTPKNKTTIERIRTQQQVIDADIAKRDEIKKTLEKPITIAYFTEERNERTDISTLPRRNDRPEHRPETR